MMADVKVERPKIRGLRQGRALSMRGVINKVVDKQGPRSDTRQTIQTFIEEIVAAYPDAADRMKFLFRSLIDEA